MHVGTHDFRGEGSKKLEAHLVAGGTQLLQGEHAQDEVLVIQEGVCAGQENHSAAF